MFKFIYYNFFIVLILLSIHSAASFATEQKNASQQFLPPAPKPTSAVQDLDNKIFLATRRLKGSPRWVIARHDSQATTSKLLDNFSCAANINFSTQHMPALHSLLYYVNDQTHAKAEESKLYWKRLRPINMFPDQPVCDENKRSHLLKVSSYPSSHTTQAWGVALVMAQLIPSHANAILQRGRQYGESRIICGFHWASDVEAGFIEGSGIIATLQSEPEFQQKLHAAQQEMEKISKMKHDTPSVPFCQAEHDTLQNMDILVLLRSSSPKP